MENEVQPGFFAARAVCFHRLVDERLGASVLRQLQRSVDREVVGMVVVGLNLQSREVRFDRVRPQADHGVDVRRHVARMRRGRRELSIGARDLDALGGERRVVIRMHEIVRRSGVLRICATSRSRISAALRWFA